MRGLSSLATISVQEKRDRLTGGENVPGTKLLHTTKKATDIRLHIPQLLLSTTDFSRKERRMRKGIHGSCIFYFDCITKTGRDPGQEQVSTAEWTTLPKGKEQRRKKKRGEKKDRNALRGSFTAAARSSLLK
jgi:hypothetical protein